MEKNEALVEFTVREAGGAEREVKVLATDYNEAAGLAKQRMVEEGTKGANTVLVYHPDYPQNPIIG